MTAEEKVLKYLKGRKTPATQAQIAKGAKVNPNTLRRIMAEFKKYDIVLRVGDGFVLAF